MYADKWSVIRKLYTITAIAAILLLGGLWLTHQISDGEGRYIPGARQGGFMYLKPQLAGCGVSAQGDATFVFTNGAYSKIKLISVRLTGQGNAPACELVDRPMSISAGENFLVEGSCRDNMRRNGMPGDVYTVDIDMEFTKESDGHSMIHTDYGGFRGPLE